MLRQWLEELDEKEEHLVEQTIRRLKKRGLSIQARVEDLGHWDTWMRSSLRDAADESYPGSPGFEPEHYILDATLDTDDKHHPRLASPDTCDRLMHGGRTRRARILHPRGGLEAQGVGRLKDE